MLDAMVVRRAPLQAASGSWITELILGVQINFAEGIVGSNELRVLFLEHVLRQKVRELIQVVEALSLSLGLAMSAGASVRSLRKGAEAGRPVLNSHPSKLKT